MTKPKTTTKRKTVAQPKTNSKQRISSSARAGGDHAGVRLTDDDLFLFNEGSHFRLYEKMGAHKSEVGGADGMHFAVWAPNAERVAVIGDFNGWDGTAHLLDPRANSGIWEGFMPGITAGAIYKYRITSRNGGHVADKADPFAFGAEIPPRTASVTNDLEYAWGDAAWMRDRAGRNSLQSPMSIYEVHPGSWMRVGEDGNRSLHYREMAHRLSEHVLRMGFTHVELLPIMTHPFFGSWGYQVTGYFAPSSSFGSPQDLMYMIDHLHQQGIGVLLDWVPSHFPSDEHGLGYFDGTHLFEHADPRLGFHPDWDTLVFNYGRHEVRSFLISNALFWLDKYHADGLRVDAVASMLYLDYSRKEGEWIPNRYGGRENLEAVEFLKRLNIAVYENYPDVQTIAEESTSWPMVSRPVYDGGLGFGLKWDMGWMHDTLRYFLRDPIHRKHHHGELPFRMLYAFSENFVLPLSHDEVVHGKGSLLGKMPGNDWQKFANLRLLYGYMYAQPGKKLLFMGAEFGQREEWHHDASLDWHLTEHDRHAGVQRLIADLNRLHREVPPLHELDVQPAGFEWIDTGDAENCVLSFLRKDSHANAILVVCNFTPTTLQNYRIGAPRGGAWRERFNSDATVYGGSGQKNPASIRAESVPLHGREYSLSLTLPPLGVLYLENTAT